MLKRLVINESEDLTFILLWTMEREFFSFDYEIKRPEKPYL